MVGTMGGIVLALVLNNGGGAWDNAKKYIEAGYLSVSMMKARWSIVLIPMALSWARRAMRIKPASWAIRSAILSRILPASLHVLIKLLSTITLVLAPLLCVPAYDALIAKRKGTRFHTNRVPFLFGRTQPVVLRRGAGMQESARLEKCYLCLLCYTVP